MKDHPGLDFIGLTRRVSPLWWGLLAVLLLTATFEPAQAQIKRGRRFSSRGECDSCHEVGDLVGKLPHEPFATNDCKGCHKSHGLVGALRLKERGKALCRLCHDEQAPGLQEAHVHEPVISGSCDSCHDPHGTDFPQLLPARNEEFCYSCHGDNAFTRSHVHEPLKEGCNACHVVHGGPNPGLLRLPAAQLCASCHDAGKESFLASHSGYAVTPESCTQCHTAHSSDGQNLLRVSSHAPMASGECATCHNEPDSDEPLGLNGDDPGAMCLDCHDESEVAPEGTHAAIMDASCLDCHNPHGSSRPSLLAADSRRLCPRVP